MLKYIALVVLVLFVVGFPVYVLLNRVDPGVVSDAQYHAMATQSSADRSFHGIPGVKQISIGQPPADVLGFVGDYILRAFRSEAATEAYYDPNTDTIYIVGEQARLEATMPKWLRPTFLHTLRHEYGHAMLADWLRENEDVGGSSGESASSLLAEVQVRRPRIAPLPRRLREVVAEYRRLPDGIYDAYLSDTFDQYMAESYARFLDGRYVPPRTANFLKEVAAGADGGD